MRFTKPWSAPNPDDDRPSYPGHLLSDVRPTPVSSLVRRGFRRGCIDGPESVVHLAGLQWEVGRPVVLKGISRRPECDVNAMVHVVVIHVLEAGCQLAIPFCFAEGPAPLLLGRDGFFDAFRVTLDKQQFMTVFELL